MNIKFNAAFICFLFFCMTISVYGADSPFLRGDINDDGAVELSDVICTLTYLFGNPGDSCKKTSCEDSLDVNDNGTINLSDPIYLLSYLFAGGQSPRMPFETGCGSDPTEDKLTCQEYLSCPQENTFTIRIEPEMKLYSIWSESYDTVDQMHAVHSCILLKEGMHKAFFQSSTKNINLIETLFFGPDFKQAEAINEGSARDK